MGHRPRRSYIVRTPVESPVEVTLPAGPPPDHVSLRRYQRFLAALARRQPDLTVVLEGVDDPFNLSAVLRTCDAVGVGTVHLLYAEKPPRISRRVSGSAQKWLALRVHRTVEETYAILRAQGLRIYSTGLVEGALAPHEVDWTQPSAVVLGNENRGVSPAALSQADAVVRIPMFGMVQSVNVTVAAAMILAEARGQRLRAGLYDAPRLPEAEWRSILQRWLNREKER